MDFGQEALVSRFGKYGEAYSQANGMNEIIEIANNDT